MKKKKNGVVKENREIPARKVDRNKTNEMKKAYEGNTFLVKHKYWLRTVLCY
jgi:hypothetical protein